MYELTILPMQAHLPECRCLYLIIDTISGEHIISAYNEGDDNTRVRFKNICDSLNNNGMAFEYLEKYLSKLGFNHCIIEANHDRFSGEVMFGIEEDHENVYIIEINDLIYRYQNNGSVKRDSLVR